MNRLQTHLLKACEDLKLDILFDGVLVLPSSKQVTYEAFIPYLGESKGIVIVQSFNKIAAVAKELLKEGYGYSVLSNPPENEFYDMQNYIELFKDWGWKAEGFTVLKE